MTLTSATHSTGPGTRVSESRLRVLSELLRHRGTGRTIEELSSALAVTRTAVQQHLTALERDGLVSRLTLRSTGGRPGMSYTITTAGLELFPRGYARLAESLLRHSRALFGEDGQAALLDSMADELAGEMQGRLAGTTGSERVDAVVTILNELGYDADRSATGGIAASNCVFHQVAVSERAACRFDKRLLSGLLATDVEHTSCIVDGRDCCQFELSTDEN
ncbi:MAG TPA: helix-turn-helix domain-containing protein [Trueperaceae bacterium]|nr:helix-turn-helix domain-containing protein [Trueperaceae bacterium]